MKEKRFFLLEIMLVESLFFFVFSAVLKYLGMGNPGLFFIAALILLSAYLLTGIARVIEMQKQEERDFRRPRK